MSGSSLVAPSGEIDSPTVKPVTFTRMTAVHITGAATAGLTVALAGNGAGTVTDGGLIHCRPTCAHSYLLGTVVTLTATPAPGSRFAGWSGDGCSGLGACRVTLATSQSVRATFLTPPRCTLTAASSTVSHPRVRHPRPGQIPPATLTLRVRCNQAAAVRIAGTITERPRGHRTTVRIAPTRVNVGAGQTTSVTVTLPVSAARALAARVPESAAFTALATSAGETGRAALTLARLRP